MFKIMHMMIIIWLQIEVDPKFHGHFRMRSGAVVKEIQEQNGNVIISFPARSAEDQR